MLFCLPRGGAVVYALDVLDEAGVEFESAARRRALGVRYRHHDVTDQGAWDALVADIRKEHGAIDVLVNNAGIVHTATIAEENVDAFRRLMEVNVVGVFLGMQAWWGLLAERGGSVINTSSVHSLVSPPGYAAYVASKAAVLGLTRTAAVEGAPAGIRVNAIVPGVVQTEILKDESGSFARQSTPMQRGALPAELARVVRFLASDESAFMTGVDVVVDGGFSAGGFSVGR